MTYIERVEFFRGRGLPLAEARVAARYLDEAIVPTFKPDHLEEAGVYTERLHLRDRRGRWREKADLLPNGRPRPNPPSTPMTTADRVRASLAAGIDYGAPHHRDRAARAPVRTDYEVRLANVALTPESVREARALDLARRTAEVGSVLRGRGRNGPAHAPGDKFGRGFGMGRAQVDDLVDRKLAVIVYDKDGKGWTFGLTEEGQAAARKAGWDGKTPVAGAHDVSYK